MRVKQMMVGMMGVCCYIVACDETKEAVIIDPGGNEDDILTACQQENLKVKYIVNTHGHPDHVCGNRQLKEATGAEIVMHSADADFFSQSSVEQFFSQLGLPASPPVDKRVEDGDTLTFGNETLKVILTPGHTPGGICLYSHPNLFTGDTLFAGGVGRTDFPGGNTQQMMTSIKERLLSLPPDTIVWPGHGYGGDRSTIGQEKTGNPFITGG
ncbi:MAG: MBL fold metallo-hydrolase [Desulfobacterales bacterium]|jgi:hydroxyacylglutathione hydrolase|nr:MBL fold metallo-hydrolase [Desulfobulbaceae bacterium]MDX2434714.1 MBL fold metallo-hydrolase [Desulfobacterales bacterium]